MRKIMFKWYHWVISLGIVGGCAYGIHRLNVPFYGMSTKAKLVLDKGVIYTSYYGNKTIGLVKDSLVGISQGTPIGFSGLKYPGLFPSWDMIRTWQHSRQTPADWAVYTAAYTSQVLAKLDPVKVGPLLQGKVLLCYEGKGYCHRHIMADWLRKAGFVVEELK
jgi:hypothetical protein